MLVAMATGTGKTFTLVHEIYRLMKAGVARRVLFLVDRRALAAQAARAFASFDPEPGLKFNQIYEVRGKGGGAAPDVRGARGTGLHPSHVGPFLHISAAAMAGPHPRAPGAELVD